MGKLLSWIVLIAVVYAGMRLFVLFQRKSRAAALARQQKSRSGDGRLDGGGGDGQPRTPGERGEPMIACAHCGVYAPSSDMLRRGGKHYCSIEHRDAGTD